VTVIVQRPVLVPEMRGKVIKLVRRVDEDGPVVDEPKCLAFLPPRGVALDIHNGGSMSADDIDIPKSKKRFADIFGKREDAVFQTVGSWNALCEAAHETVARRILMHDPHSPLLRKSVSAFIKITHE